MRWFPPTGEWWERKWHGPEQHEDKSRANIARCYAFLLSVPYQSAEDRERLEQQRFVAMLKAKE